MTTPLPVRFGLGVSIALGSIGLAALVGVWDALAHAETAAAGIVPALALALIACLVYAGEDTKSRLLNWVRDRSQESGWRTPAALMGSGFFVFFALVSVCLTHEGIAFGERMFLSPIVAALDEDVSAARAELDSREAEAQRARGAQRERIARLQREIEAQPRTWRGDRDREQLRERMDEADAAAAQAMSGVERRTAAARAALAEAETRRANAPKGLASLTAPLPFLGAVAFVPWLISIGIEVLTGFIGWIARPRPAVKREVYLTDILDMESAGLELIEDRETVRAIGSRAQSIATKAGHLVRGRGGRIASPINPEETVSR